MLLFYGGGIWLPASFVFWAGSWGRRRYEAGKHCWVLTIGESGVSRCASHHEVGTGAMAEAHPGRMGGHAWWSFGRDGGLGWVTGWLPHCRDAVAASIMLPGRTDGYGAGGVDCPFMHFPGHLGYEMMTIITKDGLGGLGADFSQFMCDVLCINVGV